MIGFEPVGDLLEFQPERIGLCGTGQLCEIRALVGDKAHNGIEGFDNVT